MVSYLEYRPELATTFIIVQSAFFLLNFDRSSAFTAFKFTNHEMETSRSKREERPKLYGDFCSRTEDCRFFGAICSDESTCQCQPDLPATNRKDRCGKSAFLNDTCEFDEQCEYAILNSMCVNRRCVCRGDGKLKNGTDGSTSCVVEDEPYIVDQFRKVLGKRFGDGCVSDGDCAFKHAICDPNKRSCQCHPKMVATNHLDNCGELKSVNEECFFREQCEQMLFDTDCLNGRCACRSERIPFTNPDGSVKCIVLEQTGTDVHTDPSMIVVLSVMCLMFIIICVVLHLFSKARWRENRTIFNTPNPRLMTVSLLREKKNERRGSKEGSCKGLPSREPSMTSLRQHSPFIESKQGIGRRESGSARSPTNRTPSTAIYCDSSLINTGIRE